MVDLYDDDHIDPRQSGRFRWLVSTCFAASVGAIAILVVIYGSMDPKGSLEGIMPALQRMTEDVDGAPALPAPLRSQGLAWSLPRSDKLLFVSGATSTRYVIHDAVRQKRGTREYIRPKPYTRIVARLGTVPSDYADVVPPFNPFKLYANNTPIAGASGPVAGPDRPDVVLRVVELLGGSLPEEDGQELSADEVADIVSRLDDDEAPAIGGPESPIAGSGTESELGGVGDLPSEAKPDLPPYTTALFKGEGSGEAAVDDLEGRETRTVRVAAGDTLVEILMRSGADAYQARAMADAGKGVFPDSALATGQEVRLTLVPSLAGPSKLEPAQFSVYSTGQLRVTVSRNAAGEFVAKGGNEADPDGTRLSLTDSDQAQGASVYASVYHAGLLQNLEPQSILEILRIHAYETDFRRRVTPGDAVEFFFDMKEDAAADAPPGELLYSSITSAGETKRFYRYRTGDGVVDYYDEQGSNSKKFLMRKPVRGSEVRLTSGFGMRFHPLLNERKMHSGIDWAAPPGTPILAAGNGTIEEAGRKGQYGNYVRIRHANGYQTSYGHLMRFGDGVRENVKVRQGQVIGYVGSTGLSSGPHLHFEILVNSRFVDPQSIQVPQERQLTPRQLVEFNKERARIDDLMRRAPVSTTSR